MPWLTKRALAVDSETQLQSFIGSLAEQFDDPSVDRNLLVRETLAQVMHGDRFETISERAPMAAFSLDPRNITFEAEYYIATDQQKFQQVKPLLWLWKSLDLTPLGQSIYSGLAIRRMLAERIFKRVGKNLKIFQNVEVSVGYNIEAGDDVTLHRYAFIDDIGGVELHDEASISDFANIYSHTHSVLDMPDVTLKKTVIGRGVRVAYHATVLAGAVLSDDSMMGAMSLVTRDFEPHVIGLGIPAKPRIWKEREGNPDFATFQVDSRSYQRSADIRANPDFDENSPFKEDASLIKQK
ncbi:MAG: acyltransferase [Trueperaceae bacterium]|nr:acyltransferase [Trueperaceae bacterium]